MMRNIKLILFIIFASLCAQSNALNPPLGVIKVNDTLFVDETEISVGCWLAYYRWFLENKGI